MEEDKSIELNQLMDQYNILEKKLDRTSEEEQLFIVVKEKIGLIKMEISIQKFLIAKGAVTNGRK